MKVIQRPLLALCRRLTATAVLSLAIGSCSESDDAASSPTPSDVTPGVTNPVAPVTNPVGNTAPTTPGVPDVPATPNPVAGTGGSTAGNPVTPAPTAAPGDNPQPPTGGAPATTPPVTPTGPVPTPPVPSDDPLAANIAAALDIAEQRFAALANDRSPSGDNFLCYTEYSGDWDQQSVTNWCTGFIPGAFWFLHAMTGDAMWAEHAHEWTEAVGDVAGGPDNDTGFQINCSAGQGIDLASNAGNQSEYEALVLEGAASLYDQRYNPTIGAFRTWEQSNDDPFRISNEIGLDNDDRFEVNVDMLMNMELVLRAAALLDATDPATAAQYRAAVESHFANSFRDLVRSDFGSFQVVQYSDTGAVLNQRTHQGAEDESTWSRGQSWVIYGHAMYYRYTNDPMVLARAQQVAQYMLDRTVNNPVPPTDYSRTGAADTLDSSAASIACSAFLEMHEQVGEGDDGVYITAARRILTALTSDQFLQGNANQESLLWSCTERSGPNTEDGSPHLGCIFGDYYMLECMHRYQQLTAN